MSVNDKVVIVTGASSGIGLATAMLLAQKGAKVVLAARSIDKLEKISAKLPQSLALFVDMEKENTIKDMVEKTVAHFKTVDILVNNAGRGYDATIEETDPKLYQEVFNLDVIGPLIAMQQVIPFMKKQKSGSIVNISSGTALMAIPGMAAYSSSKRALVGLSLTAREELKQFGIQVSVVYPFITVTNFEKNTIKSPAMSARSEADAGALPQADTDEYVAEKIFEAIVSGNAEIFAHEWMGK